LQEIEDELRDLGLVGNIIEAVKASETAFPGHQLPWYYAYNYIENALNTNLNKDAEIKDQLMYAGFNEETALYLESCAKKSEMFFHQSLIYWIQIYYEVETAFKKCPNTSDVEELKKLSNKEWKKNTVNSNGQLIDVYKLLIKSTQYKRIPELVVNEEKISLLEKTNGIWFHGTSYSHAKDILNNGIMLNRGRPRQDFSDGYGFYLSQYYETAAKWAIGRNLSPERYASVLVYNFDYEVSENYNGMDLYEHGLLEIWKKVINYNRNGVAPEKELKDDIDETDFIRGPMSGDGHKEDQLTPKKVNQLCIKNRNMAKEISRMLIAVFYIDCCGK